MKLKNFKKIVIMLVIILIAIIGSINQVQATDDDANQTNTTTETQNDNTVAEPKIETVEKPQVSETATEKDENSQENKSNSSENGKTVTTATKPQTTSPSNNANLANLGVQTYDFTGFKPATTTYNVTVPNEVTSVTVYATTQNSGAKYTISGNDNLKEGNNTVTITVTAQDGKTTKEYQINVERKVTEDKDDKKEETTTGELKITSIEIDSESNIKLEPEFKPEVYEYTVKIEGELTTIPMKVTANKEDAVQKIDGNENLKDGENEILITLTDKEETDTVVYKIKVLKNVNENKQILEEPTEPKEENSAAKTIIIGIATVALLILIVLFIIAFKKNK